MKRPTSSFVRCAAVVLSLVGGTAQGLAQDEPIWAYGFVTPALPGEKAAVAGLSPAEVIHAIPPAHSLRPTEDAGEQTRLRHLPGSKGAYSLLQIRNGTEVVDWFPEEHPPLTPILRHGPSRLRPLSYGCAFCHLPNGQGRPENAPVIGLPAAYFARQMLDFKEGRRASADRRKANTYVMIALAQSMSDEEISEAAAYFASLAPSPWIRVVETDHVPRTRTASNMFIPLDAERTEPLGQRIIEVPAAVENVELLRDPHTGFIAYVPIGSVRRGQLLVTTGSDGSAGAGRTIACTTCHGTDLRGVAEIPGIAGRSPSYLARQLYDMQQGTRKTALAQLMQPAVAQLKNEDIVAIAAYVSSLGPVR